MAVLNMKSFSRKTRRSLGGGAERDNAKAGWLAILAVAACCAGGAEDDGHGNRIRQRFNGGWRFLRADAPGAEQPAFDDRAWEAVGVPHTVNHRDVFDQLKRKETLALFDTGSNYWCGVVWYRKPFRIPARFAARKVCVEFEGVSQVADVWWNGRFLGQHKGSSVPFVFDLTPGARFGGVTNVLAVRVDNTNEGCRGIPGAMFWTGDRFGGIVRDVWLHVTDRLHVPLNVYSFQETWGTYVATTRLEADGSRAEVAVRTRVRNDTPTPTNAVLVTRIVDADGREAWRGRVPLPIEAGAQAESEQRAELISPRLWSPDSPHLYRVVSRVEDAAGAVTDVFETPLGVLAFRFDPERGFFLNGQHLKLRGYGMRQGTYGGLLNAISDYLHAKDVRLLRNGGGNFIRQGHSAQDPAVMDACDRLGVFVAVASMDTEEGFAGRKKEDPEQWWRLKQEFTRDIAIRDRNHPSTLLWEFSNGILSDDEATVLTGIIRDWDDLARRPTLGVANAPTKIPRRAVDVIGTHHSADLTWNDGFGKPLIMTEYGWKDRYGFRADWDGQVRKAVRVLTDWGAKFEPFDEWAGFTSWTLSETHGESHDSDGVCSKFGALDANGRIPKEEYHAYRVAYAREPLVRVLGHWTHPANGVPRTVVVAASSPVASVELFVNGRSRGVENPECYLCHWLMIPFERGVLRAEGRDVAGKVVCRHEVATAGEPARLVLEADPLALDADGGDCAIVTATVVDAAGAWCPTASNAITFACEGPVSYRGGFNHRLPNTHGDATLFAEAGKMAVGIRSTGEPGRIVVRGSAAGLASGKVEMESRVVPTPFDLPRHAATVRER
jgi:beta-galactosidase